MTAYVALLRAANVGGTGKLAMADLRAVGERCGFGKVSTYIASGNLLFASDGDEATVKDAIESGLQGIGKRCRVIVRTAAQVAAASAANPFPNEAGNRLIILFLATPPTPDELIARHQIGERWAAVGREIFIAYGSGIGTSKFDLPVFTRGTGRNANTVATLATRLAAMS